MMSLFEPKHKTPKAWAFLLKGRGLSIIECVWDGQVLKDEKGRRSWAVRSEPRVTPHKRHKGRPCFLVHDGAAVTFDVDAPTSRAVLLGNEYAVTSEFLYELGDTEDLRGMNLATAFPWSFVWLSMGAGAGALVVLGMILYVARGMFA